MVFFFPGQGTQSVGMGSNLLDKYPSVAQPMFEQANDILGFNLQKLCLEGPEDILTDTKNAQPAILTVQAIILELLKAKNIKPKAAAGHSLGEISALMAAEVLSFEDALRLVQKRGALMSSADPDKKGGMSAILGLSDEQVIAICKEASQTAYCEPVNFNAPGQVVISGLKEGCAKAGELASTEGAKVVHLVVGGAFHSKLMENAANEFATYVKGITFKQGICPVVSNVTAEFYSADEASILLPKQIASPVRWVESVHYLKNKGFSEGVELSSSPVIRGLIRKIDSSFSISSFEKLLEA
ncbi:MAG: ACP S-malonyltransferase [Brevinema sp.]